MQFQLASRQTSQPIAIAAGTVVAVTPAAGATALVEYTAGTIDQVNSGAATWTAWPYSTVLATTRDSITNGGFARVTASGGAVVVDIHAPAEVSNAVTVATDLVGNFTNLTGPNGAIRIIQGNTLGVIGDSRDDRAFGGALTGTTPQTWTQSYASLKWALGLAGQPFRRVADFSKSSSGMGITTSTAAVHPTFPEQMASVLAAMPSHCWIRLPTNDIQNGASAAAVWSVFKPMVDTVLAAGIKVELVACTLLDSTKGGYSAFTQAEIVKLNDLARVQYATSGSLGIVFHDTAAIAMQQGVATCAGVSGAYADITHFQNGGAYLEGAMIAQSWLTRFKPLPFVGKYAGDSYRDVPANNSTVGTQLNTGSSNYLPNGMFDLGTPVSGLAQGWAQGFATNCTFAASIVAAPLWDNNTDGKGQQLVVTATAANAVLMIQSANMFADIKLLKRYLAGCLISIQAGAVNLKNVRMELAATNGTITFSDVHGLTNAEPPIPPNWLLSSALPSLTADRCAGLRNGQHAQQGHRVPLAARASRIRPDVRAGDRRPRRRPHRRSRRDRRWRAVDKEAIQKAKLRIYARIEAGSA
jgi:hypothetical protein